MTRSSGKIITDINDVHEGDLIETNISNGRMESVIKNVYQEY